MFTKKKTSSCSHKKSKGAFLACYFENAQYTEMFYNGVYYGLCKR